MSAYEKHLWVEWLKAAGIRALKTWAQAGVAYLGSCAFGIFEVDWVAFASVTLMSAVLSLLTSLAGLPEAESPVRGGE